MPTLAKLKIGDFILDPSRGALIGAEGEIGLEPKVVDVLLALAAQPGVVLSRDELIDAVWKAAFGADERLTRAISLLRKALGDERGSTRYIETISKRGYRLLANVEPVPRPESAPLITHDNTSTSEPTQSPPLAPPPSHQSWRRYAIAAGILAVLGGAGLVMNFWRNTDSTGSALAQDVVELSPLHVIDKDPGADAFARRAHASLKRILASNQVLLVDNADRQPQASSDAASADPEFVLSGLLEQIDDQYAITLYFNDRQGGQTLWSQHITRSIAEGEGLREEIGTNAAYVIQCALKQRRAASVKPTAVVVKVYLETCDPGQMFDGGAKLFAIAQRLIEVAPDDAYGHGLLALAYAGSSGEIGLDASQSESYRTAARKSAARARELNPRDMFAPLAEVWVATGVEYWRLQDAYVKDWGLGHPIASGAYIGSLRGSGRLNEAVRVKERAIAATALRLESNLFQAVLTMMVGDHEKADRVFAETLSLWPDSETAHWYRFVNASFYGDPKEALKLLNSLDHRKEEKVCWRAFIEALGRGGNTSDRAAVRNACDGGDWSKRGYTARMLAALGDTDGAYEIVKDENFDWDGSTTFLFYPEMAQFRRDARFMPFVVDSGLVEYWLTSGNWPDFCSDKDLAYDCKTAATLAMQDKLTPQSKAVSQH